MVYGTGDSFGHSSGNGKVLYVFTDCEVAKKAKQDCYNHPKSNSYDDNCEFKFKDEFGTVYEPYNPTAGFFETLEDIELKSFYITA